MNVFYIRASPGGNEMVTLHTVPDQSVWPFPRLPKLGIYLTFPMSSMEAVCRHTRPLGGCASCRRIRLLVKYLLTPKADHLHHTKLRPTLGWELCMSHSYSWLVWQRATCALCGRLCTREWLTSSSSLPKPISLQLGNQTPRSIIQTSCI